MAFDSDEHDSKLDARVTKWPIYVNLISAMVCMGNSAVCHLLWAKSPWWCLTSTALDYQGIVFLIFGQTYPLIYYRYACGSFVWYG